MVYTIYVVFSSLVLKKEITVIEWIFVKADRGKIDKE